MTENQSIEMADLLALIRENFESLSTVEHILPDTNLHSDLGLDSLGFVRLQVAIEDHFGLRFDPFSDDLATAFETAGPLLELICDKLRRISGDKSR